MDSRRTPSREPSNERERRRTTPDAARKESGLRKAETTLGSAGPAARATNGSIGVADEGDRTDASLHIDAHFDLGRGVGVVLPVVAFLLEPAGFDFRDQTAVR